MIRPSPHAATRCEWACSKAPAVCGEALSNGELNIRETQLFLFQLQQALRPRRQTKGKTQTSVDSRIRT